MLLRRLFWTVRFPLLGVIVSCALSASNVVRAQDPAPPPRAVGSSEGNKTGRLEALSVHDSALDDPMTVVFEISVPFSLLGPDQGLHREKCTFTATRDARAMIVETVYDRDPVYHQPGTGGTDPREFDEQGDLFLSRSVRKQALSAADINIMSDEQEKFRVAPDGTVLKLGRHVQLYRFPIGSPDSVYQFDQFRLAVGRGFAKYLRNVRSERVVDDTRLELIAAGRYSSGFTGEWKLLLEEAQDTNLVRQAEFFAEGNPTPIIKIKTSGWLSRGDIALASQGWISYTGGHDRDFILDVRVLDISTDPDSKQLAELRKLLSAPVPADVTVIDVGAGSPDETTARSPQP